MNKKYVQAVFAISIFASALSAQTPAPAPVSEKHEGFYASLMLGGGLGLYKYSASSGSLTITETGSGFAFQYGGKLGFALSENFILFGDLTGWSLSSPKVTLSYSNGQTQSGTASNSTYSVMMFGAGLGYYTDSNFFILASLGMSKGTVSNSGISVSSDFGFGTNLNIGQEWWVAKDFAIGVALVGHYSSVQYSLAPGITWTQLYAGIAVTATYN